MPAKRARKRTRPADPLAPIRALLAVTFSTDPALIFDHLARLHAAAEIMRHVTPDQRTTEAEFLAGDAGAGDAFGPHSVKGRRLIWGIAAQIAGDMECAAIAVASGDLGAAARAWRRCLKMTEAGIRLLDAFPLTIAPFLPGLTTPDLDPTWTTWTPTGTYAPHPGQ